MSETVEIKSGIHPVFIGQDMYPCLEQFIFQLDEQLSKIFVIVDEHTSKYCLPDLYLGFKLIEQAEILEIKSGESFKSLDSCHGLWEELADRKADRKSLIINLGGGVLCDMGGFVASTYKRGIRFLNIPTTLMAQVDASIGGKQGVDFNHVKNLLGVFQNPIAVFINPGFLATLADIHLLSGFAEMIKHALIANPLYLDLLKSVSKDDIACKDFNPDFWKDLICESVKIKNSIVLEDPFEKGIRKKLNFGHSFGHAFESWFLDQNDQTKSHGECVAMGMHAEAFLSYRYCNLSRQNLSLISDMLLKYFNKKLVKLSDYDTILSYLLHDKKNQRGRFNFTLLSEIGKAHIDHYCDKDILIMALDYYRNL